MSDDPISLGSILFTMVDPHRGHEVDYNRWYERDHFYAGCMIGPWNFAGGRFVAPRRYKDLRPEPDPSIAASTENGSYVALYWILDGHHEEWNRWAYRQVKVLHAEGRMFEHRDHVHTRPYAYDWGVFRDPDGVPAALALDHRFAGLAVVIGEAASSREDTDRWYRQEHLPSALAGSSAAMCLCFTAFRIEVDVPGVPKAAGEHLRYLHLYFLDDDPAHGWERSFASHDRTLREAGMGRVLFASPFIPTQPGTDAYTGELW